MNYIPEKRIPRLFTDFDNSNDFPTLFPDRGNPNKES